MENNLKNASELKNPTFWKALKNSIRGISLVIKSERNIKIQLVFTLLVIILGFMLKINFIEWAVLAVTIFFVLVTEILNTAVEKTVDMITDKYDESARNVKDISAGAVLFSAICSVIVGIIIFLPKILVYIY